MNQWLNPLKRGTDSKSGGYGSGSGACPFLLTEETTHVNGGDNSCNEIIYVSTRGHGECLRRNHDKAAAEELEANPVERSSVNVG